MIRPARWRWLWPALALASSCAFADPARPPLWKVSDDDNHVYLVGSFHLLKPADYPLSAAANAAFADAEVVAFEISPEEMRSPELPGKMTAAATLGPGRSLQDSLPPVAWKRLQRYAMRTAFDLAPYRAYEPWLIAMVISRREMEKIGFQAEHGLDQYYMAEAARAKKRTLGLETADDQVAALDSMTAIEQRQLLSESLEDAAGLKARLEQLHGHWRRGEAEQMEKLLASSFKRESPELYQRINVARNQAWLPKISRFLDQGHRDDMLVVVGAMHLLGEDGLVAQLRARGYRVERL